MAREEMTKQQAGTPGTEQMAREEITKQQAGNPGLEQMALEEIPRRQVGKPRIVEIALDEMIPADAEVALEEMGYLAAVVPEEVDVPEVDRLVAEQGEVSSERLEVIDRQTRFAPFES